MECERILLTTDFSAEARKAYAPAVSLAQRLGADLHLVHVVDSAANFYFQAEGFGGSLTRSDFYAHLQSHLEREVAHPAFAEKPVRSRLVTHGSLVEGLRQYEEENDIDLTVLASHGHSGLRYALLGSSAERIVRGLKTPVLTYRERPDGEPVIAPRTVLVPYDFSENASVVLPTLRFLARTFLSKFVLFFVVEPLYPFFGESSVPASYDFLEQAIRETPKLVSAKFEDLRREELAGVNVSLEFGDGTPTVEIIDRAKGMNADLVIMATHGWSGFRHFFLGSVAETVVRKAPCSVLTVRSVTEE